jgi:hypothetical protein
MNPKGFNLFKSIANSRSSLIRKNNWSAVQTNIILLVKFFAYSQMHFYLLMYWRLDNILHGNIQINKNRKKKLLVSFSQR